MYFLLKIRRCYKSVVKSLMLIKPRNFPRLFFHSFTAAEQIVPAQHQKNNYNNSPEYIFYKQPYYHSHCNPEHHKTYYSHHRSHLPDICCSIILYADTQANMHIAAMSACVFLLNSYEIQSFVTSPLPSRDILSPR